MEAKPVWYLMADKASIHPRGSHLDQTECTDSGLARLPDADDNIAIGRDSRRGARTTRPIEAHRFATIFQVFPDRGFIRAADSR
jgi:hypothetical protein